MASPCTVTTQLQTADNQNLQGNAFVRFRLRNFAGFVPRVIGTNVIAETQVDELPNGSGLISVTLWGNDNIDPTGTFYTIEWWNNGRITSQGNFLITGSVFDLDSAAQMNPPTPTPATSVPQITLQTNGVNNGSQTKLNLASSDGSVVLTDNGLGTVNLTIGAFSQAGNPIEGDVLSYSVVDGAYKRTFVYDWSMVGTGSGSFPQITFLAGPWLFQNSSWNGGNNAAAAINSTVLPSGMQWATGVAGTSNAFWVYGGTSQAPFNQIRRVHTVCQLGQTSSTRFFWGMQNQTTNVPYVGTDNPNVVFMGFRFSSTTDTNFMAYCCTSNVAFTAVNTGVAADTNVHTFDIVYTGSRALFYIDGTLVATITTNLPASTATPAFPFMGIDNKASGVSKSFVFYVMKGSMPIQYR